MARSTRPDATDSSTSEVTAHDLAIVVHALTGRPVESTGTESAKHSEAGHSPRTTDLSAHSPPPSKGRRRR